LQVLNGEADQITASSITSAGRLSASRAICSSFACIGLYDELAYTREMRDRRYDEMESGRVQGIDGEEAYRRLMEETQARRPRQPA
jgi:hypothetical protein